MHYAFASRFNLLLCLTLLIFSKLSAQYPGSQKTDSSLLVGCWTDSREENVQGSDQSIYRPCDYKEFPASRYRLKMILRSDSTCSWLVLSPYDRHYMTEGKWTFNKENNELKIMDEKGKVAHKFIVEAVEKDILKVRNA